MADPSQSTVEAPDFAQRYREWRRAYYDRFPAFWGTLPGESHEEYAIYGALEMPRAHAKALRTASARLYQVMTRLALALQQGDDQALVDLGVPPPTLPYCHTILPRMPAVMCGRFEFAMTKQGLKLLEFNAETPTFVVELFHMNSRICADFGLIDPNRGCADQLRQAILDSVATGLTWIGDELGGDASVVFTSYANRPEERGTSEYYLSLLQSGDHAPFRVSYCGLNDLRVASDALYTASGERVDVLYKLYPTEHLMEDEAPDGTLVGLALMELVRRHRLAIINPPVAFVLQNKGLMALLWALREAESEFLSTEERIWIERYLLPTYLDEYDATGNLLFAAPYVRKPVYGREGVSVTIRNGTELVEESEQRLYGDQVMVYQQYAPLPTTRIPTESGPADVYLVHNCFVAGGTPSAVGVRASPRLIFDDNAYFLPVCHPRMARHG